jgi:hypothetical protein
VTGENAEMPALVTSLPRQVCTIYSVLFIVFIILIIVTSFITVALTYFQLAVGDHRWGRVGHWTGLSGLPCEHVSCCMWLDKL